MLRRSLNDVMKPMHNSRSSNGVDLRIVSIVVSFIVLVAIYLLGERLRRHYYGNSSQESEQEMDPEIAARLQRQLDENKNEARERRRKERREKYLKFLKPYSKVSQEPRDRRVR